MNSKPLTSVPTGRSTAGRLSLISLALLGLAIWAFVWAVRKGQFDDLDTPARHAMTVAGDDETADVAGVAGAPKLGDEGAWGARVKTGEEQPDATR